MKAVSGGIKKHSITLKKGDVVFIEGAPLWEDESIFGKPLLYLGTHAQTGDYMLEHQGQTLYINAPIVGAVIPSHYMEELFEVFDTAFDTGDTQPSSVDGAQQYDFGEAKARKDNENITIPDMLRAAAKDIEDKVFGEAADAAILVLRLPQQDTYLFRPFNIGEKETVYAFEECKINAMGYVHKSELVRYDD